VAKKKTVSGKCDLCPASYGPHPALDEHHVTLQAAGGKRLPTILICPNCHTNLHKQALNVLAKGVANKAYFSSECMPKALPYVKAIIQSIIAIRETNLDHVPITLMLKMPRGHRNALHTLKMDAGFKNLEKFCVHVLVKYAREKGIPLPTSLEFD